MSQGQQALNVRLADQIVKNRAGHQRQAMLLQRGTQRLALRRQIAPRPQLDAAVAGRRRFLQNRGIGRQMGVVRIIHAPTAGRIGDRQSHGDGSFFAGNAGSIKQKFQNHQ